MAKLIWVTSGRDDNRTALWERHPDHPGGEIMVDQGAVVQVAKTAKVLGRLKEGDLVEVDAPAVEKKAKEPAATK